MTRLQSKINTHLDIPFCHQQPKKKMYIFSCIVNHLILEECWELFGEWKWPNYCTVCSCNNYYVTVYIQQMQYKTNIFIHWGQRTWLRYHHHRYVIMGLISAGHGYRHHQSWAWVLCSAYTDHYSSPSTKITVCTLLLEECIVKHRIYYRLACYAYQLGEWMVNMSIRLIHIIVKHLYYHSTHILFVNHLYAVNYDWVPR